MGFLELLRSFFKLCQVTLFTATPELKKYCKSPKIKDMVYENMVSSWNVVLTGGSFQSFVNNGAPS